MKNITKTKQKEKKGPQNKTMIARKREREKGTQSSLIIEIHTYWWAGRFKAGDDTTKNIQKSHQQRNLFNIIMEGKNIKLLNSSLN